MNLQLKIDCIIVILYFGLMETETVNVDLVMFLRMGTYAKIKIPILNLTSTRPICLKTKNKNSDFINNTFYF